MNYCSGWFKNLRIKNKRILMIALAKVVPASLGRIRHPLRHSLPREVRGEEGRGENGGKRIGGKKEDTYIHSRRLTHTRRVRYTLRKRRVRHWWSGELHNLHTDAFALAQFQNRASAGTRM